MTKTLLVISLVSLAVGFTTDLLWEFGKPFGTVVFGLFLISKMFEKEVAQFDTEEKQRLDRAKKLNGAVVHPHDGYHEEPFRAAA